MAENKILDVLILGNGPSGCTAAIYSARANLNPVVLTGEQPGGQLITTTEVENFPGFTSIGGTDLVENMRKQAEHFGAKFVQSTAQKITKDPETKLFSITGQNVDFKARTVIVATGASARMVGCKGEKEFWSKGITACATCDGFFYKGKEVVVIGGGDTAMEEATFLTRFCPVVHLIHRRDTFRASKIMAKRAESHPKIKIHYNSVVSEVLGDPNTQGLAVTGVTLTNTKDQSTSHLPVGGVFYAIGHTPNSAPIKDLVDTDEEGYVLHQANSTATKCEGLYVCGDVQDKVFRQAITSAGTGCMAAIEAERYLEVLHSQL